MLPDSANSFIPEPDAFWARVVLNIHVCPGPGLCGELL